MIDRMLCIGPAGNHDCYMVAGNAGAYCSINLCFIHLL